MLDEVPDLVIFDGAGWMGLNCVGGAIGTEVLVMQSRATERDGSGCGAESRKSERKADEGGWDGSYCMYSVRPGYLGTQAGPALFI